MRLFYACLVLLIISCAQKEPVVFEYYPNGSIKKKIIFKSEVGDSTFISIRYSDSGVKTYIQEQIGESFSRKTVFDEQGKLSEIFEHWGYPSTSSKKTFNTNGSLYSEVKYQDGGFHGMSKFYMAGKVVQERMFYLDKEMLFKQKFLSKDQTTEKLAVLLKDGEDVTPEGNLYINTADGSILKDQSDYYTVSGPDICSVNDILTLKVEYFSKGNYSLQLNLGSFNDDKSVILRKQFDSESNSLVFNYVPNYVGHNLITGELIVQNKEEGKRKYLFFYQCQALPTDSLLVSEKKWLQQNSKNN